MIMDMYFSKKCLAEILMIKYLGNIIDTFPEEIKSTVETPVADRLFQVRDNSEAKFFPG